MTLHRIKAMLYLRKIKPAVIAQGAGVSPITVRTVLNGHGTSRRVKRAVADLLNKPFEKLWGNDSHCESIITNKKKAVND